MVKKRKAKAKPICSACYFWVSETAAPDVSGADQGHCHRFPPPETASGSGPWPMTIASDWCGEYKSK